MKIYFLEINKGHLYMTVSIIQVKTDLFNILPIGNILLPLLLKIIMMIIIIIHLWFKGYIFLFTVIKRELKSSIRLSCLIKVTQFYIPLFYLILLLLTRSLSTAESTFSFSKSSVETSCDAWLWHRTDSRLRSISLRSIPELSMVLVLKQGGGEDPDRRQQIRKWRKWGSQQVHRRISLSCFIQNSEAPPGRGQGEKNLLQWREDVVMFNRKSL